MIAGIALKRARKNARKKWRKYGSNSKICRKKNEKRCGSDFKVKVEVEARDPEAADDRVAAKDREVDREAAQGREAAARDLADREGIRK